MFFFRFGGSVCHATFFLTMGPEVSKISEKTAQKHSEIVKNRCLGWPQGLKKEVLEPSWGCLGAPGRPKATKGQKETFWARKLTSRTPPLEPNWASKFDKNRTSGHPNGDVFID